MTAPPPALPSPWWQDEPKEAVERRTFLEGVNEAVREYDDVWGRLTVKMSP